MDFGIKDKAVLVTGGSKGIGKAIAEAFAAEGARVAISARGREDLDKTAAGLARLGGRVLAIAADVTRPADVERMKDEVISNFGTLHVLVNNAGGVIKFATFDELSDDEWAAVMDLNLLSAVRVTRAFLPCMRQQKWGRIINISSESGSQPDAEMPHYNAAKAALNNFSKSMSKALAKDGILVNTVSPAMTMTERLQQRLGQIARERGVSAAEAETQMVTQRRPHMELRRAGRCDEIAGAAVFLASAQASFITGANLRVDGGSVASV